MGKAVRYGSPSCHNLTELFPAIALVNSHLSIDVTYSYTTAVCRRVNAAIMARGAINLRVRFPCAPDSSAFSVRRTAAGEVGGASGGAVREERGQNPMFSCRGMNCAKLQKWWHIGGAEELRS